MKKLILFILTPLIFSCGGNSTETPESGNFLENLSYTVDTVVMDEGGELLDLRTVPTHFDLNSDQNKYYLYRNQSAEIYVFNLDEMKLIKKLQFDKEGPNGIPYNVSGFQLLDENRYLIYDFISVSIFDSTAKKVASIPFTVEKFPELKEVQVNNLTTALKADDSQQIFFSLPYYQEKEISHMAIWDNRTGQSRIIQLPEFVFLNKYYLILENDNDFRKSIFAYQNLRIDEDRVIIFSSGTSSIYSYEVKTDSLLFHTYTPNLIPAETKVPEVNEVSSLQAFDEVRRGIKQVSFGDFQWDESRGVYLRLASIYKQNPNPELPAKSEVYLLAFDKSLNLIGENKLEGLPDSFYRPFFKDGKFWFYVNVNDELGFRVIDFKF